MLKIFLMPLALVYRIVISIRNFCYEANIFKQHEFPLPIISVGNITVGGTGKTPHSEYLLRLLKDQFNVAYISRGYKRKTKGYVRATAQSTALEIGDEALQIARNFPQVPVAVCEKRVTGVERLLEEAEQNFDAIILDDAFQHRSIKPHINMLLIDYNRPIHEDKLLPLGRLRETIQARFGQLHHCDQMSGSDVAYRSAYHANSLRNFALSEFVFHHHGLWTDSTCFA